MEIYGLSALNAIQSNKPEAIKTSSEQNFMNNLSALVEGDKKADVPTVFAGTSKELDFWKEEVKTPSKATKLRTKDDALAEIEKILRQLTD